MQRQIIACVDGSKSTSSVISSASWLSNQLEIPLLILHVLDQKTHPKSLDLSGNIGMGSRESLLNELAELDAQRNRLALEHGKKLLEAAMVEAKNQCQQEVKTLQRHGDLSETLAEWEEKTRILVIGRSGEHSSDSVAQVGGQVENIVRTMKRPVMIANNDLTETKDILIAYDGSQTSQKVLELAAKSPLAQGKCCHIVMVGQQGQSLLDRAKLEMEKAGHEVKTALLNGEVDAALLSYAHEQNIKLMALGAYGHSRIRQFFIGSHTTKILYKSDITLLFLR